MTRTVGFQLVIRNQPIEKKKATRAGAIASAKKLLGLNKAKVVGIVRVNDKRLVMTISKNKTGGYVITRKN